MLVGWLEYSPWKNYSRSPHPPVASTTSRRGMIPGLVQQAEEKIRGNTAYMAPSYRSPSWLFVHDHHHTEKSRSKILAKTSRQDDQRTCQVALSIWHQCSMLRRAAQLSRKKPPTLHLVELPSRANRVITSSSFAHKISRVYTHASTYHTIPYLTISLHQITSDTSTILHNIRLHCNTTSHCITTCCSTLHDIKLQHMQYLTTNYDAIR